MPSTTEGGPADWAELPRQRRALVVVDVVESVRLMQAHEDDVIDRWRRFVHEVRTKLLPACEGRMVKSLGDGMLLEFKTAPQALAAAFACHRQMQPHNEGHDEQRWIWLRVGLHVAEVVADEVDLYGQGVNLAARITALANEGGVVGTQDAVDELLPGIDGLFTDGGRCYLKHMPEPVQIFHMSPVPPGATNGSAPAAAVAPAPAPAQTGLPEGPSLAMLPVQLLPGDADAHLTAQLFADSLLARLSCVPGLRVISRLSTEQLQGRAQALSEVTSLLGCDYLIAARLYTLSSQRLLTVELVEAATAKVMWGQRLSVQAEDLLAVDEPVTQALAQHLVDQIATHQLRQVNLANLPRLDSQSLQFSAITLMHRQARQAFVQSRDILDHLIARHPRATAPHAWLAKWHVLCVNKGLAQDVQREGAQAMAHTRRALDLDGESALALAMQAFVHCHISGDLGAADRQIEAALAVNPSESWAWLVRSTVASFRGSGEQAWLFAQRARALSPLDPVSHYYDSLAASAAVSAQRYSEARHLAQQALTKDARHLPTLRALAIAQVHLGEAAAARDTMARVLVLQPGFNLKRYVEDAPAEARAVRQGWALALREAGAPDGR